MGERQRYRSLALLTRIAAICGLPAALIFPTLVGINRNGRFPVTNPRKSGPHPLDATRQQTAQKRFADIWEASFDASTNDPLLRDTSGIL